MASEDFARLFDDAAGRPSGWNLKRRIHQTKSSPALISFELEEQLAAAAEFEGMLKTCTPPFRKRYRDCESHLLRIIEQRQRIDFDIEDIQRQSDVLTLQISNRRNGMSSGLGSHPASDEALKGLSVERDALRQREVALKPERETLERLISIYVDFVEALNGHVGVVNAMTRKLSVDNEQRIALLKAVRAQLNSVATPARASIAALIGTFEADVLAGHDLAARKAVADEAFTRRLEARSSVSNAEEAEDPLVETQPET
jgi:hypothetical protein